MLVVCGWVFRKQIQKKYVMKYNFKITYSLFDKIYSGIIKAKHSKEAMKIFSDNMEDWQTFYRLINIEMI